MGHDALLVGRAKRGDLDAFEELYRTHVGRVFGLCRRLLGDDAEAEEMTQRVFIKAWEKLAGFRGASKFSTWLHRIAVNQTVSEKRSRWSRDVESLGDEGESLETIPAPSGLRLDLETAVMSLPSGARQVLVLHDVEGYTHAEVAQMLGVTAGTSKAHLFRARSLLRERLG